MVVEQRDGKRQCKARHFCPESLRLPFLKVRQAVDEIDQPRQPTQQQKRLIDGHRQLRGNGANHGCCHVDVIGNIVFHLHQWRDGHEQQCCTSDECKRLCLSVCTFDKRWHYQECRQSDDCCPYPRVFRRQVEYRRRKTSRNAATNDAHGYRIDGYYHK